MTRISRRAFNLYAASTGLAGLSAAPARAQELPRRYAGVTLNVMSRTSPAFDATVALGGEFTEATGIKLQVTRVPPSDHYAKLMLDLTSGTNAYDLTLFVHQWKIDLAPFLADLATLERDVPGAPALALDDYAPKVLDVYGRHDDRLIGLPILGDVAFLLWNRDSYAAKGLDAKAAPATWDELVRRGRTLTGDGLYGFALPAGKTPQCYVIWTLLFQAFGGKYFGPDGQPDLAGEAGLKTMRFMAGELQSISPPGNLTWDYNEVLNSFSTGKSAHAIMWAGGLGLLSDPAKSAVAGRFEATFPPSGSLLGGTSIGVNAKAKQPEAARLYVAWLTSQAITRRTAAGGTSPARISTLGDPALVARFPHYPSVQKAMLGETFGYIPTRESEQILLMVADEANAACARTKSPDEAAQDLQRKAVAFMKRRGYLK